MTSHCENITPLASRFDESLLRLDSGDWNAILDMTQLANSSGINDGSGLNGGVGLNRATLVDVTNKTNNILDLSDLSNYPVLSDRFEQGPITFVEIADFINSNNYDIDNLNKDIADYVVRPTMPVPLDSYLGDLDYYMNKNFGASISGGICGSFNNFFSQLVGLFVLIDTATELMADIKNLLEKDPVKLAKSLTLAVVLQKIKDAILKIVDKVIEQLKKRVQQVVAATVAGLSNIQGASQMVYQKIQEIQNDINDLFDVDSIEEFKKKIEALMAKTSAQFERLTVENVALMMFRFCQMSEVIEGMLNKSVDGLKALATSVEVEKKVLETVSLVETKSAVENGAIRVSKKDRDEKQKEVIAKTNESQPTLTDIANGQQSNYITPREMSQAEIEEVNSSVGSEAGIPGKFTYSSSVKNQNDYEGKYLKGAGYKKIDPVVFAKLLRVCEMTGKQYVITSGYRSPKYNASVGGAKSSVHMTGKAIDISVRGSYAERSEFIVAASRAGFTGIGVYSTFIHLDTGARRSWIAGSDSSYPVKSDEYSSFRQLAARHNGDKLRTA